MRRRAAALTALALVLGSRPARAQLLPGFGNQGGKSELPVVEDVPGPAQHEAPGSVKLFDSRRQTQSMELDIGPVFYREQGHDERKNFQTWVGEIAVGTLTTAHWNPFFLTGYQTTLFRVLDDKSYIWSVLHNQVEVGARFGPFEPYGRIGVGLLTIDAIHGNWSFELLTPRVAAGVGIGTGKFRLDIQAQSEYLWRWFGPDYLIRGITVGLRLDLPKPKRPVSRDTPVY